jgi:hypothetical protein
MLPEVEIKGTMIMMVHRGDTVVYNAEYFQLSQGSMLDKLIEMMPGLEIHDGGVIYYKGKRLDNLMVNGKDFFKGDPAIALQNLPAYMVKEVKVYEKESDDEFLNVHSSKTGQPNTIDVSLKRQYAHGWIANTEVAGGPAIGTEHPWKNSKYMARLFGLHYGLYTRLGLVGNFNNINDSRMANRGGNWESSETTGNGVSKTTLGAMMYSTESKRLGMKYNLDLKVTHQTNDLQTKTSATSFLTTDDVYNRASSTAFNKDTHLNMTNDYSWTTKGLFFSLNATTDYHRAHNRNKSLSAQFSANPEDSYRCASLDSLYAGPASQRLLDILTNQLEQSNLQIRHQFSQNVSTQFSFLSPLFGNHVNLYMDYHYHKEDGESYQHYDLRYKQDNGQDFRNRYFDDVTQNNHFDGLLHYNFLNMMSNRTASWLKAAFLIYSFTHDYRKGGNSIYNLHLLNSSETLPLGELPSVANWRQTSIDHNNSRRTVQQNNDHSVHAILQAGKKITVRFLPYLNYYDRTYTDNRTLEKATFNHVYVEGNISVSKLNLGEINDIYTSRGVGLNFDYALTHILPGMDQLLNLRDDSNPLAVSLGNSQLKAASNHHFEGHLDYKDLHITAGYTLINDAIAMGYDYDAASGIYTYHPENIDGNWLTNANVSYNFYMDKNKLLYLESKFTWDFNNSVDLIDQCHSTVKNHTLGGNLNLNWRYSPKTRLSLYFAPIWQYATSHRANYDTRNTWDIHYGANFVKKLPFDIEFDTDLTMYSRRGYDDQSMNDNDLVWNASFGWDFDFLPKSYHSSDGSKGTGARPWSLRLEVHDLLQQLSTTRRVLNAQGITETWYNSTPSYLMLHLSYRFAKQPKN